MANVIFKLGVSLMGEKIKKRIIFHANQAEFHEKFEDKEILPKEFGGKTSWKEMNHKFSESLRRNEKKLLDLDDQYIEDKREVVPNCGSGTCLAGSFRKLEVD